MKRVSFYLSFLTALITFTGIEAYHLPVVKSEIVQKVPKKNSFGDFPHLTSDMKHRIAPYLIQESHPMKATLDKLFGEKRVTRNKKDFLKAGFKILDERPRSFVIVARHAKLKDHLVKCYFDTEYRVKDNRPSWKWLVDRCIGARKVDEIIKEYNIKHFAVCLLYTSDAADD